MFLLVKYLLDEEIGVLSHFYVRDEGDKQAVVCTTYISKISVVWGRENGTVVNNAVNLLLKFVL
jgi:hypothetical protein